MGAATMATTTRNNLGELSDLEAVDKLVNVRGLSLIEVGCAAGTTAHELAKRGASVLGVEPDPVQAKLNRTRAVSHRVTLVEASAQNLPVEDCSCDGVFMFRSLHHVPENRMDQALVEAARVLRSDGFLYVAEPGMDGSFFSLMRPFHDERKVRTFAQSALGRTASHLFLDSALYSCFQYPVLVDFESLIERFTGLSFNNITRSMIDCAEVRDKFEAARTDDGYAFSQPMLINLYRGVRR